MDYLSKPKTTRLKHDRLFEPYSDQPTATEVRDCLLKLFLTQAQLQRQSKRNDSSLAEDELPRLWILATSASERLLSGFRAQSDEVWPSGVYFLGDFLRAAIIAINQLPCTPDTLWLRILGKGKTRERAIAELMATSEEDKFSSTTLELLLNWQITIKIENVDFDEDIQELIMQLSPAYLKWREETLQEGKAEGKAEGKVEGKAEVAINLLNAGMKNEQVEQLTGLTMEIIQKLTKEVEGEN